MIFQSVKMALKSILSNKMRSFLTMLGVIIGVFSLVVLVSLVSGASGKITDTISSLGTDQIDVSIYSDTGKPFTMDELINDVKTLPNVENVAPEMYSAGIFTTLSKSEKSIVFGTTPTLPEVTNVKIESGRFLMNPDIENHSNVIVINHELAVDVMGRADVVGESIRVDGREYMIIGVTEKEASGMMALLMGTPYRAYIPYTTMARAFPNGSLNVTYFIASAKDDDFAAATTDLEQYFAKRYNNDEEAYSIYNESTITDSMGKITGVLSVLLGGIAGISLLVGGIGIMNIMLVSVTERTREIGIRKAIGAQPRVIMLQFLIEAIVLSLMGCLIGIGFSWFTMQVINIIGKVDFGLSPTVIIVAVAFSMGVGMIFGLYPARKAARMRPIDALRYN